MGFGQEWSALMVSNSFVASSQTDKQQRLSKCFQIFIFLDSIDVANNNSFNFHLSQLVLRQPFRHGQGGFEQHAIWPSQAPVSVGHGLGHACGSPYLWGGAMHNIEWEKFAASFQFDKQKTLRLSASRSPLGGAERTELPVHGLCLFFLLFFLKEEKKCLQKTSCICCTGAPCASLSQECVFCCRLLLFSSVFLHGRSPPGRLFHVLTQEPRHFPRPGRRAGCAAKWSADALSGRERRRMEALTWKIPRRPVLREPRASQVEKKTKQKKHGREHKSQVSH